MSRLRVPLQSSHCRSFRSGSYVRQAERRGGEAKLGFVATSGARSTSTQFKLRGEYGRDAKVNATCPCCQQARKRKRTGRPLFHLYDDESNKSACSCVSVTCTYACFLYNITVLARPLICSSYNSRSILICYFMTCCNIGFLLLYYSMMSI